MTNELLELKPDHERAIGNKQYYEKELALQKKDRKLRGDDGSKDLDMDFEVNTKTEWSSMPKKIASMSGCALNFRDILPSNSKFAV